NAVSSTNVVTANARRAGRLVSTSTAAARRICGSIVFMSNPFHRECDGVAATETEYGEAGPRSALLHRIEQRHEHAGAGRTDRMSERNRSAVHVDAVPVPAQLPTVRERLYGERLVRLDQIVVADLLAFLLHQATHCAH